jgi:hypothetical protein
MTDLKDYIEALSEFNHNVVSINDGIIRMLITYHILLCLKDVAENEQWNNGEN